MTRMRVSDREANASHVAGMLSEQIGPNQHMTPEGFLLAADVPIARTGWMMYGPGETPVKTGDNGVTMIHRDPEVVFHPRTMASFEGKSVTDDHPHEGVHPGNYKSVTVGTVHNVRRGTGEDADTLRADLLIKDKHAIAAVKAGKREVSAGYESDYETTGPGEGRQINIVGNHVALVTRGRCGPRCAIGDRIYLPPERTGDMPSATRSTPARRVVSTETRQRALDALAAALDADTTNPAAHEMTSELDDMDFDPSGQHIHLHMHNGNGISDPAPVMQGSATDEDEMTEDSDPVADSPAFKALGKKVDDMIAAFNGSKKTGDAAVVLDEAAEEAARAEKGDSTALETSYKALVADAEVLSPGFRVPVFDAKSTRVKTIDSMCAIRRRALDKVYDTPKGQAMLHTVAGVTTLDTAAMSCADVATLFKSAAGAARLINNTEITSTGAVRVGDSQTQVIEPVKRLTIADLNALNHARYPRA